MDAFDFAKAGNDSTFLDWARAMKIVSYGVVREVHDKVNVRCAYTVQQSDLTEQLVDVSLLSLSSPLFSLDVTPLVGDQVLILGLDAWSDAVVTGGTEQVKGARQGYNNQACVGLLARTVRMGSAFLMSYSGSAEAPVMTFRASGQADIVGAGDVSLSLISGDGEEHPVNVDVLENRPCTFRVMSRQERTIGADVKLTIGKNIKGNPVAAAVSIDLDEQSEVTLTSKSGATVTLDKDLNLTVKGKTTLNITGDVSLSTDGNASIKAGGDVAVEAGGKCEVKSASGLTLASGDAAPWQPNIVPTCPFGMPHGGASGGIAMLKGQ